VRPWNSELCGGPQAAFNMATGHSCRKKVREKRDKRDKSVR
jgi:hypothetical protein